MSKYFFILLFFFNFSFLINCQEDTTVYVTINRFPTFQSLDLKCFVKKNTPPEIKISTSGVSIQTKVSFDSTPIVNIQGAKLKNIQTSSSVDMSCSVTGNFLLCNKEFGKDEKLEPGNYYFESTEEISGTSTSERKAAIKPYRSLDTFVVINDFPEAGVEKTVDFGNNPKINLEFTYKEDILSPPKFIYDKTSYKCFVDYTNPKKLQCQLNRYIFKPSKQGNKYELMFYNLCGENEANVTLIAKGDENWNQYDYEHPSSGISENVIMIILLVFMIGFVVGAIFAGKYIYGLLLAKRQGVVDNVMATSFKNDDSKQPIVNENENETEEKQVLE